MAILIEVKVVIRYWEGSFDSNVVYLVVFPACYDELPLDWN